jgi:hypothetical protein
MANYYDKYLQAAGIGAPYKDLTKSQIEEKNKGNPLSGYGFMSAQEKQKRQLEMAMYEREMQRQQDMFQQQLLSRMSSQGQIGYQSGAGLLSLLDHLKQGKQAPEAPAQDDPEVARYRELVSQLGPEQGLASLGSELQNPQMIADAQQAQMEKQKANLEMEDIQSRIKDRETRPNQVITAQRTMPNGMPGQVSLEAYGKDPKTGRNLYLELGEAVKGSVTDTNEGFANTKAGVDTRTKAFESMLGSTANALDAYDRLDKIISQNPEALGWSGRLIANADTVVNGLKNLGTSIAKAEGREATASMEVGDYKWGALEGTAANSEKVKSLVLQLAYAQAAATGDSSRSLSDRDVQNQIDTIGGQVTNPETFKALMAQNRQILVQKLQNMGQYTKINGKPISSGYEADVERLIHRVNPPQPVNENSTEEEQRARLEFLRNKHKNK